MVVICYMGWAFRFWTKVGRWEAYFMQVNGGKHPFLGGEMVLLMAEIPRPTTWDVWKIPENNGINYQPQLVSRISEPSTVWFLRLSFWKWVIKNQLLMLSQLLEIGIIPNIPQNTHKTDKTFFNFRVHPSQLLRATPESCVFIPLPGHDRWTPCGTRTGNVNIWPSRGRTKTCEPGII